MQGDWTCPEFPDTFPPGGFLSKEFPTRTVGGSGRERLLSFSGFIYATLNFGAESRTVDNHRFVKHSSQLDTGA
jgi:hypothetical protein